MSGTTSTEQRPKRRHHTVPRFYLRGFADGEQLRVVALPGERRFLQSVNDATVETDFYSLPGHPDGDDVLEDALGDIEDKVAPIVKRIAAGKWPLSPEERAALAWHIALQGTRSPAQRRNLDATDAQLARLQIGMSGKEGFRRQLEAAGSVVPDEQLERMWAQAMRPEGPPLRVDPVEFAEQMIGLAQRIYPYIIGRPWTFVQFDRRGLITSDDPVTLVPSEGATPGSGVGYGTAGNIIMPMSRRVALMMGDLEEVAGVVRFEDVARGAYDERRVGSTAIEKLLNDYTAHNASKWLYLHPDDERFIPQNLPEPNPVSMRISSSTWNFNGEPQGMVAPNIPDTNHEAK